MEQIYTALVQLFFIEIWLFSLLFFMGTISSYNWQ